MEKLINQVLNNLLLEFTVTTGIFGSETYVFVDGLWHQKGELFPFNYEPKDMAFILETFYSRLSAIYEVVTIRDVCEKEIKFLENKTWELRKIRESLSDIDEKMSHLLGKRIKELKKEIASYEVKILEAEGKEEFTEAEIVGLFGYADFFFLIDEAYIVRNVNMKRKIRQSV